MRTENLAVMFTDIQGFTAKTSRQTRQENALMLRRHDALLIPVVRAFGGRHVKSIGDAWLVVFRSPTNSVLCGMAIQDRLWDYNRRVPDDDRIQIRVAVNLGEVRVTRSIGATDVFGEPVNIAARVEGEAEAGEVLFTEAVYLAMNKAEVPAEELGYRDLKGVPDKVRLYRAARGRFTLTPTISGPDALEQPPFGNHALARVKGIPAPDPSEILRRAAPRTDLPDLTDLVGVARRIGRVGAAIPARWRMGALVTAVLLGLGGTGLAFLPAGPERLISAGRFDEARTAIDALADARGRDDPEVLYLQARLEHERWHRGQTGPRDAFRLYGRALGAGSSSAGHMLAREGESKDCAIRRLAARALSDSRSEKAVSALRDIAAAEPEEPEPRDALERVKRIFGSSGRCGDGDLAREGLRAIEGER